MCRIIFRMSDIILTVYFVTINFTMTMLQKIDKKQKDI